MMFTLYSREALEALATLKIQGVGYMLCHSKMEFHKSIIPDLWIYTSDKIIQKMYVYFSVKI